MQTLVHPFDLYIDDMAKRELHRVQEARENFRERIDEALENAVHTVVTRHGRPVVVIVPMEWYRRAAEALGEPTEI